MKKAILVVLVMLAIVLLQTEGNSAPYHLLIEKQADESGQLLVSIFLVKGAIAAEPSFQPAVALETPAPAPASTTSSKSTGAQIPKVVVGVDNRNTSQTTASATTRTTSPVSNECTEEAVRQRVVQAALSLLGTPYDLGGGRTNGIPSTIDCSTLVVWAYRKIGYSFPWANAATEMKWGRNFQNRAQAKPADLVIFQKSAHDIDHVGMMLDTNRFVEATWTYGKVRISSFNPANTGQYRADLAAPGRVRTYVDIVGSRALPCK